MEPDLWEWQPDRYASLAITHKAVRQGRGAGQPPTHLAFRPPSVKTGTHTSSYSSAFSKKHSSSIQKLSGHIQDREEAVPSIIFYALNLALKRIS